jgi:hypothetical protein
MMPRLPKPNTIHLTLMRTLLAKKDKYYKEYADSVFRTVRQLRYGIETCKKSLVSDQLAFIRKQLVDWQSNEDEDALCQTNMNYTTFVPVNYRNDSQVQFDTTQNAWGPGYYNTGVPHGPQTAGVGFTYGNASQNIIEVNSGGCLTRINLNPAVTIAQNIGSFMFTQATPSTSWVINHGMGKVPNVFTEDTEGNDIVGIIEIIDSNLLKVYFNQPVAGKAYLS